MPAHIESPLDASFFVDPAEEKAAVQNAAQIAESMLNLRDSSGAPVYCLQGPPQQVLNELLQQLTQQ